MKSLMLTLLSCALFSGASADYYVWNVAKGSSKRQLSCTFEVKTTTANCQFDSPVLGTVLQKNIDQGIADMVNNGGYTLTPNPVYLGTVLQKNIDQGITDMVNNGGYTLTPNPVYLGSILDKNIQQGVADLVNNGGYTPTPYYSPLQSSGSLNGVYDIGAAIKDFFSGYAAPTPITVTVANGRVASTTGKTKTNTRPALLSGTQSVTKKVAKKAAVKPPRPF